MIKMYRIIVEDLDPDKNPRVYVVGEKGKNILVRALSKYKFIVEEFFVDNENKL